MSNAVIRAELETRLKAWADAQIPEVPIAFQNVPFTKPTGPYLEAILMPNGTFNKELSGTRKTYIGIFQVNCWAPSGKGMGQVEALSQSVVNLFPILPKSGAVSIEQTPTAEKPLPDDSGWVIVPVTIKYRMETL
jgi:hypothetical protein